MDRFKGFRVFLGLLVGLLFQVAAASTTIVGNVTVAGPAAPVGPIAGAFVMVSRPGFPSQILATAKTDLQGNYSIGGLAAGNYQVRFSQVGFDDGLMQAHDFKDQVAERLNAQLVPLLTGIEVPQPNEKQETKFTISNPNPFSVTYDWQLPTKHLHGTAVAPPGSSVLDTVQLPHVEAIQLFVDGVQVQPANPSDVAPPVAVSDLTGFVDDSNHSPLAGVQVTLASGPGGGTTQTTFTLTDGSYVFHEEPAGPYKLTFTLASYVVASENVNVKPTGTVAPTVLLKSVPPPPPNATVSITVVDSTNSPTPNVTVTISYSNGTIHQLTTNGNGLAQFTQQPVGVSASITASTNDGSGRSAGTTTSGFVSGNNSVRLTLPLIATGAISGTVADSSNHPLAGVDVVVLNASNSVVASTVTGGTGTYSVSGLTAGTYSMTFSLAHYVTLSAGGISVTSAATTSESVSLNTVASTLASVAVVVTDGGLPAVGASVSIAYSNGTNSATLITDSNGNATFTGQPAGIVGTVTATAGDGTGRSISSVPAAFPAQTTTTVNLALPPVNNAVISGVVRDNNLGSGILGASVTVTDSKGNVVGIATTNSDGNYSVVGLGLQTYTVTFAASGYLTFVGQAAGNTELDAHLAPFNSTVNIQVQDTFGNAISGATVNISYVGYNLVATGTTSGGFVTFTGQPSNIPVIISVVTTDGRTASLTRTFLFGNNFSLLTVASDFGAVSGVVIDNTTSVSLPGASVSVVDFNNNLVATTVTNSSGAYVVQDLNPGTYTFTFSQPGYQTLSLTVPVTASVSTTQNAALTPLPGSIQGTVTGSTSQARVPGAQISLQGPASLGTTSDSNGNFTFASAPAGMYTGTLSSGIFSQPISVTVAPNQATTLNLVLDTSSVAGKVIDQNGNPLAGAQIVLTGPGFISATVVTDQSGNYVVNRESNFGSMAITATYSGFAGGPWMSVVPLNVPAMPPEDVISPIVVAIPALLNANVTLNGNPVTGAQVTVSYLTGTSAGPIATNNGVATFNSIILGDPAVVSVLYVDGTGTVYTGSVSGQSFVPGTNNVPISLSPANSGQSGRINIQVVDQNGNPLVGASVTIVYSGGATSATLTSDSHGNVLFPSQQTGVGVTINVSYTDPSNNTATGSQSVPGGFTNGNNFYTVTVAQPTATVTVSLTNASNGNPIGGATVTIDYGSFGSPVVGQTDPNTGETFFPGQPVGIPATITVTLSDGTVLPAQTTTGFRSGSTDPANNLSFTH